MSGLGSWESCKKTEQLVSQMVPSRCSMTAAFGMMACLDEGVDCHNGKIRLSLGVVDEVQIHQLLQLKVIRLQQAKLA